MPGAHGQYRHPSVDELRGFETAVQEHGGALLDEPCRAIELPAARQHGVPITYTTGCGGCTRVAVNYGGKSRAIVCGVCDAGPLMPRFA